MLLGLFFATVGFAIDPRVLIARPGAALAATLGLITAKAATLAAVSLAARKPLAAALRTGLLLAPGGEFGFVALGLAASSGVIDAATANLLTTTTALSMALTPLLAKIGDALQEPADRFEEVWLRRTRRERDDAALNKAVSTSRGELVVVVGYGRVGKVVCELLDAKLQRYVRRPARGPTRAPNTRRRAPSTGAGPRGDRARRRTPSALRVGGAAAGRTLARKRTTREHLYQAPQRVTRRTIAGRLRRRRPPRDGRAAKGQARLLRRPRAVGGARVLQGRRRAARGRRHRGQARDESRRRRAAAAVRPPARAL